MFTISDTEFKILTEYIRKNYGINIKDEKRVILTVRLRSVLTQKNFNNFHEYYKYVISDKTGEAVNTLIDRITINHTFFMREADHFYFFRDKILPRLADTVKDRDLRIWSAGCSTGEEPYTLAMILYDYFEKERLWWDTKVLATDISGRALDKAKKGIYKNEAIEALPSIWRLKYFKKYDDSKCVLDDRIKREVIFRKFNLMDEVFPFKRKFHVVFCRNVMIYFDSKTREILANKLYKFIEHGGYLFIGHSESLDKNTSKFKYIGNAIYYKE